MQATSRGERLDGRLTDYRAPRLMRATGGATARAWIYRRGGVSGEVTKGFPTRHQQPGTPVRGVPACEIAGEARRGNGREAGLGAGPIKKTEFESRMNIYVGNLPYSVRDEELRATFEAFGTVDAAEVIFDKRTRRSRGYGFVEMGNEDEARRAIEALNGKEFHGRELRVDASQPKSEKPLRSEGAERGERSERAPRRAPAPAPSAVREVAQGPAAQPAGGLKGLLKRLFG